jgi:hypothetical protein
MWVFYHSPIPSTVLQIDALPIAILCFVGVLLAIVGVPGGDE